MAKVTLMNSDEFPSINIEKYNKETVEEIYKPYSISFSIEQVSRFLTHQICESEDSYTQQSMRYVEMNDDSFINPNIKNESVRQEYQSTMRYLLNNYSILSELKDEKKSKGRPKAEDYRFAPIEDNRYALSLASTSNIYTTLSGNKLINFFASLNDTKETREIYNAFKDVLPSSFYNYIGEHIGAKDHSVIANIHKEKLDDALNDLYVKSKNDGMIRASLGALTSTHSGGPSLILEDYIDKYGEMGSIEKLESVGKRVLGYGHESIIEHAKFLLGMNMSLVTYHQLERHRMDENIRENFRDIPVDREVVVPPRIYVNNEANEIFNNSVLRARNLREILLNEEPELSDLALLNGTKIGVLTNINARAFKDIAAGRLCNNAQWEIKKMFEYYALELRKRNPVLFNNVAPNCILQGKCPEGKLTCGKYDEVKKKYLG